MASRKIYGYWDCPYCDSKGIRGDKRECPGCGRPRSETTKFYMKSKTDYIENENIDKFSGEPDWMCSYCNSYNPSTAEKCIGCGADREEKTGDYFSLQHTAETESSSVNEPEYTPLPQNTEPNIRTRDTRSTLKRFLVRGIGVLVILAVAGLLINMLVPKPVTIDIQSFSWDRTIDIEESYISAESDWYLPSGADLRYTREEFKENRQVLDHYETKSRQVSKQVQDGYDISYSYKDNGDGSFDEIEHKTPRYITVYETEYYEEPVYRTEPVYDTRYYYNIKRWRVCNKCITNGTNRNPYWGEPIIDTGKRRGNSYEKYYVHAFNLNKKEKARKLESFTVPYNIWTQLPDDGEIKVKIGIDNSITEIVKEE